MAWGEVTWPTPPPPSPMNQRDREEEREERPHTLDPSPKTSIIHILHQKYPMTRLHYNKILVEKKKKLVLCWRWRLRLVGSELSRKWQRVFRGTYTQWEMGGMIDWGGSQKDRESSGPPHCGWGWVGLYMVWTESPPKTFVSPPPPLSFSPHLPQPTEYVWIGCVRPVLLVVNEYSLNLLLLHSLSQDNDKNNYFCPYNLSIPNNNKGLLF